MAGSNVSAVVNYFPTVNEGFTTTLGSTISASATTVPLAGVTGLTNGTIFVGIIEPGATNQQVFTGTVDTGGSQITGVKWTRGTNVGHTGGVAIVDYTTGTAFNMLSAGFLKQHKQTGAHSAVTADSVATTGNVSAGGTLTVTGAATLGGGTVLNAGDIGTADIADSAVTPVKMLGVDLFAYSNPLVASPSPPSAGSGQFYMQCGTNVVTTNGSGNATISFPTAFPNGVMIIVAVNGDGNTALNTLAAGVGPGGFNIVSPTTGSNLRVNWIAIGW